MKGGMHQKRDSCFVCLLVVLVIIGVIVALSQFRTTDRTNKEIPVGMGYTSGEMPEQNRLEGTTDGGIIDNEWILADPYAETFSCKSINGSPAVYEAEKVEYYHVSAGSIVMGGWSFRYAVKCGDRYFVVDGSDAEGVSMYGPFMIAVLLDQ